MENEEELCVIATMCSETLNKITGDVRPEGYPLESYCMLIVDFSEL